MSLKGSLNLGLPDNVKMLWPPAVHSVFQILKSKKDLSMNLKEYLVLSEYQVLLMETVLFI